jgi:amino acid adenylation domain-containing protein
VSGRRAHIEPGPPFFDYITWRTRQDAARTKRFWTDELVGAPKPFAVADVLSARNAAADSYPEWRWSLSPQLSADLSTLARRHRVTLSAVFQTAWAVLIARYGRREDVVFGLTVSGRTPAIPRIDRMVGNLINTIPFRVRLGAADTVETLLGGVQATTARVQPHEHAALADIQRWVGADGVRGPALFDSILVFENARAGAQPPANATSSAGTIRLAGLRHVVRTNYPIVLQISPTEPISMRLAGAGRRLGQAGLARMAGHLTTILEAMAVSPTARVATLPMLAAAERHQLIAEWNDTASNYPEASVTEVFERQVAATPTATALVQDGRIVTYGELNALANRVARRLTVRGLRPETPVAILARRSPEMIAALIGVLKAGAVCMPLDVAYPPERLAFMLRDSGAAIVLADRDLMASVAGADVLPLHDVTAALDADANLRPAPFADQLACLVYTSGSTGTPKAVAVPHRAIVRLVCGAQYVDFDGKPTTLVHSPPSFDASFFEIWGPLLHGGQCALFSGRALTAAELRRRVRDDGVDLLWLTASLFHLLVDEDLEALSGVRQLIAGGETLSPRHVTAAAASGLTVVNGYGPTEATTFSTSFRVAAMMDASRPVPLGRPIANTRVYVLDARLDPRPIGATAEIFIGGAGIARGYPRDAALTAWRFVPDPFAPEPGARMYRTGDLARVTGTGDIEFLGRADTQVKVRGFRVEPGEVEAVLRRHAAVRDCAVVADEDVHGSRRLVAYVALDQAAQSCPEELRRAAALTLPDYMVPAEVMIVDSLPLTTHGKLDRRALPAPARGVATVTPERVRAWTIVEETLAGIWRAVLGAPVDRADDFFARGGHSLLAIRAVSRIREAFGVELPLQAIFEHPTFGDLASEIERLSGAGPAPALPSIEPAARTIGDAPLSFAQERLWVIDQMEPGIVAYNLPVAFALTGREPRLAELLRQSVDAIVERHEVLRTTLPAVDGHPVQRVHTRLDVEMPLVDLSLLPADVRVGESRRLVRAAAVRPFDLAAGPLVRALLIRHAADDHLLFLAVHHIVADGASLDVLFRELVEAYSAFASRGAPQWAPLVVQYRDYARWQRDWMRGPLLDRLVTFWRGQLADAPPPIRLPIDRPRPAIQTFAGGRQVLTFSRALSTAVDELALAERGTLFMVLLAGFFTLLQRYTGDDDIVVGTPAANRNRVELEPLLGFFVNTLVLRTRVSGRRSFRDLIAAVRATTLRAYAHQDLPFEKLVEELQPARQLGASPYFQVMFAMYDAGTARPVGPLTIAPVEIESIAAKFDLTMYVLRRGRDLTVSLEFNRNLFDDATITRMLTNYQNLMRAAADDPGRPVAALVLMSPAEVHQVMHEWNDTDARYPDTVTIPELFEAQVRRTPGAIAIRHGESSVTYDELNRMANRVAHHLSDRGVGPESTVGVLLPRTIAMVSTLLGVLKAGGAYVPFDPDYPGERLAWMLNDAQASVVIADTAVSHRLPIDPRRLVLVDDVLTGSGRDDNPAAIAAPGNAAYVIYTSGSTGRPKGTVIEHRSTVVLLQWIRETFGPELIGMLAGTSIGFDVSIFELFGPLCWGGSIRLIENALEMTAFVDDPSIRLVGSVPTAMSELVRLGGIPRSATTINLAGEPVPPGLAEQFLALPNVRRVANLYGPTEGTTFSSMALLRADGDQRPAVGRPVSKTRFFVLDDECRPVPIGAAGQVYIAGDGLARGYLGRPDLTAERFLPDPCSGRPGARMYRTGDRGRYLINGELDYLGRVDHQVKIRGMRVELGEIEAVLREQPGVEQAVVVARPYEPSLAAYLVPEPDAALRIASIQTALGSRLPSHMVPSVYCVIDRLPLLPNGKVDRSALPEPRDAAVRTPAESTRPGNSIESGIVDVLAEAINRSAVGVHDHFFTDLGGHSLLAIQVTSRIRERLGLPMSVIDLFQFPTARALASHLSAKAAREASPQTDDPAGRRRRDAIDRRRAFRQGALADTRPQESR